MATPPWNVRKVRSPRVMGPTLTSPRRTPGRAPSRVEQIERSRVVFVQRCAAVARRAGGRSGERRNPGHDVRSRSGRNDERTCNGSRRSARLATTSRRSSIARSPEVYHYLLHRCRHRSTAEDLTSETFLAAVDAIRRDGVAVPSVRVAHRHHASQARRSLAAHGARVPAPRGGGRTRSRSSLEAAVDPGRAMDVLARLTPIQRTALTLRHVDGLSVSEVANLLGRSVHATETLLVRSRAAFRWHYSVSEDADV